MFMQAHLKKFRVSSMCRILGVERSGFYAWRKRPESARAKDDRRLTGLIKQSWLESGTVYGYRKVTQDLRDQGERCTKNRVARLMNSEGGLREQLSYGRRFRSRAGQVLVVAPNRLDRHFNVQRAYTASGHRHHLYLHP